jgi:hypothetical protein
MCEDFDLFQPGFEQIHRDLKLGKRSLLKTSKTDSMVVGRYYVVEGQLLLLQRIVKHIKAANGLKDGRTRCIIENGTETDILLQTLRKNVMANGYAVSDTQEETEKSLMNPEFVSDGDKETGYIYVLSSLSQEPEIACQKDLYKIGFTTHSVEERIAGAADDPTYLMSAVKIVATYRIINMNSMCWRLCFIMCWMLYRCNSLLRIDRETFAIPRNGMWFRCQLLMQLLERLMMAVLLTIRIMLNSNVWSRLLSKKGRHSIQKG